MCLRTLPRLSLRNRLRTSDWPQTPGNEISPHPDKWENQKERSWRVHLFPCWESSTQSSANPRNWASTDQLKTQSCQRWEGAYTKATGTSALPHTKQYVTSSVCWRSLYWGEQGSSYQRSCNLRSGSPFPSEKFEGFFSLGARGRGAWSQVREAAKPDPWPSPRGTSGRGKDEAETPPKSMVALDGQRSPTQVPSMPWMPVGEPAITTWANEKNRASHRTVARFGSWSAGIPAIRRIPVCAQSLITTADTLK